MTFQIRPHVVLTILSLALFGLAACLQRMPINPENPTLIVDRRGNLYWNGERIESLEQCKKLIPEMIPTSRGPIVIDTETYCAILTARPKSNNR